MQQMSHHHKAVYRWFLRVAFREREGGGGGGGIMGGERGRGGRGGK